MVPEWRETQWRPVGKLKGGSRKNQEDLWRGILALPVQILVRTFRQASGGQHLRRGAATPNYTAQSELLPTPKFRERELAS